MTVTRWLSAPILGLLAGAAVLLGLFALSQRSAAEPIMPPSMFKPGQFKVSSALGFCAGLGLFGAVVYLPLYLQIVDGASATASGLWMLPLVAGLMGASIISGRLISRTGRYRQFPIAGGVLMTIGMFLLSRLDTSTGHLASSLFMLIVGVGVGLVMQVPVLVAQNITAAKDIGAATSTITFFRSIGGSIGVAALGAVFSSRLASELAGLGGGHVDAGAARSPEAVKALPAAAQELIRHAFSGALHHVFMVALSLSLLTILVALTVRNVPLRSGAEAPDSAAAVPAE